MQVPGSTSILRAESSSAEHPEHPGPPGKNQRNWWVAKAPSSELLFCCWFLEIASHVAHTGLTPDHLPLVFHGNIKDFSRSGRTSLEFVRRPGESLGTSDEPS